MIDMLDVWIPATGAELLSVNEGTLGLLGYVNFDVYRKPLFMSRFLAWFRLLLVPRHNGRRSMERNRYPKDKRTISENLNSDNVLYIAICLCISFITHLDNATPGLGAVLLYLSGPQTMQKCEKPPLARTSLLFNIS